MAIFGKLTSLAVTNRTCHNKVFTQKYFNIINPYLIKEQAFGGGAYSCHKAFGEELIHVKMRTRCDWSVEPLPKTNHHQMSIASP